MSFASVESDWFAVHAELNPPQMAQESILPIEDSLMITEIDNDEMSILSGLRSAGEGLYSRSLGMIIRWLRDLCTFAPLR
jgi:hypothetical protein